MAIAQLHQTRFGFGKGNQISKSDYSLEILCHYPRTGLIL